MDVDRVIAAASARLHQWIDRYVSGRVVHANRSRGQRARRARERAKRSNT